MKSLNIKECKLFELQIAQTRHPLRNSDEKMSWLSIRQKRENISQMCTAWKVPIFNVCTIIMESVNIKK